MASLTQNDVIHDVMNAAEERGWIVTFIDMRSFAVVLEEPLAAGVTMRLAGRLLTADFIRTLPIARMPAGDQGYGMRDTPEGPVPLTKPKRKWAELREGVSVADDDGAP